MVLTLRSPHDVLEAVPYLLGFEPADSLVVLGLRGRRRRLGVTARFDLVDAASTAAVTDRVADALRADRATAAVLVAYGSPGGADPDPVVESVRQSLEAHGIPLAEALRVMDGRWTSYTCVDPGCCPAGGTPVPDRLRAPGVVGSAAVLAGRQVLADREALVATLAPIRGADRTAMQYALDRELRRFLDLDGGINAVGTSLAAHHGAAGSDGELDAQLDAARAAHLDAALDARLVAGPDAAPGGVPPWKSPMERTPQLDAYADETIELVRTTLRGAQVGGEVPPPLGLSVDDSARLIVGMLDVPARDACLDGFPDVTEDLRSRRPALTLDPHLRPDAGRLWAALVPRAVRRGTAAPVSTLLAWNAYIHHGGGAQLTIALERALDDAPGYVMAEGLLLLLSGGVTPRQFRAMVSGQSAGRAPGPDRRSA